MQRLSKAQIAERDALVARLTEAQYELALVLEEAQFFISGLFDTVESYYEERSDAWRDSDRGQAYYDWLTVMEDTQSTLDQVGLPDYAEALNNIADEPGDA